MNERIDTLELLIKQTAENNAELFRISSKLNGHYEKMDNELQKHFKEDNDRFMKQDEDHIEFKEILADIKGSLENLQGLSDFFKGAGLLRKPLLIVVAFIIGTVALFGGIKSLLAFFIPIK